MAPVIHVFDPPVRFVPGTVGLPGERTFFLQARSSHQLMSVVAEKEQVDILSTRIHELIQELAAENPGAQVPTELAPDQVDNAPLDQPIMEDFRAGTITLSWDREADRIVVEVYSIVEVSDPFETDEEALAEIDITEPDAAEMLLIRLTYLQALSFALRGQALVQAGRSQCQFCGDPIDATGHLCPRSNGYRRHGQL